MQFKTLFTILSVTAMATASPILDARTDTATCSANFTPKCCNSFQSIIGLIPILNGLVQGIGCVNVVAVGSGQCNQPNACCTTGDQAGLVNVQVACVAI